MLKKVVSMLLCAIVLITCLPCSSSALNEDDFVPYVIDFSLTSPVFEAEGQTDESRASGLIYSYGISLTVSGNTIRIQAQTNCNIAVVKCGFKNLVVQRKKASSSSWSEYYDYGDVYSNSYSATVNTTLAVESGYEYRVSCKHYAKKSLLVTESISHTSNVVAV